MLKVLVIDADSDFASLVGRALLNAGHETRIVGDAKYGIVRAKAFEADLVLVSGELPGVAIADYVQELKPLVPGRIIVCGNSEDAGAITAAVTAGASDYVLKNSGPDKILARILKDAESSASSEEPAEAVSDSKSDEDEDSDEMVADVIPKKAIVKSLRAPVQDGKRPFVVVVAHADAEKRAFQTEIVERLNSSLHVIEVGTTTEAIQACEENRTVMVSLDWELTDPPTKQALKTIRESATGKAIALFVTYKSKSPEKQRLAEFGGAMAFAGEPWDDGSLEGQFAHTLDVIRKRRRKAKMLALKAQEEKAAKVAALAEAKAEKLAERTAAKAAAKAAAGKHGARPGAKPAVPPRTRAAS
ncbi:MAG: response regulator transcription factor [Chloroflexi bacterium]|jgi:DNA-binding response OmpR family regulator|nr:response regulator transcription factor [Chloroflexota bacterium]